MDDGFDVICDFLDDDLLELLLNMHAAGLVSEADVKAFGLDKMIDTRYEEEQDEEG